MFELNRNIDEEVAKWPGLITRSLEVAQEIAAEAQRTAPVDSGAYRDSISAVPTKMGARVIASDFKSAWIEFGVPAHGIPATFNLRHAALRLGYKFRKSRG